WRAQPPSSKRANRLRRAKRPSGKHANKPWRAQPPSSKRANRLRPAKRPNSKHANKPWRAQPPSSKRANRLRPEKPPRSVFRIWRPNCGGYGATISPDLWTTVFLVVALGLHSPNDSLPTMTTDPARRLRKHPWTPAALACQLWGQ